MPATSPALPSLPGFRLLSHLGTGPSGQVYRAHDLARGRDVAVKLLDPRRVTPRGLARFARTARAALAAEGACAGEVLDVVTDPARPHIVMELLPGESLGQLLLRTGPFGWKRARGLAHGLAVALEAAHDAGLVHGALKPGNVFLDGHRLYLTDFGAHALLDPPRRDAAQAVADYLTPEQIRGEPVDARTDLYALGLLLHEVVTGRRLFAGRPQEILRQHLGAPPPAPSRFADLPPSADALLADLLQKAPALRPSASELRGRLSAPERTPDGKATMEELPTVAWSRPLDPPPTASRLEETVSLPNFDDVAAAHHHTTLLLAADRPDPNATVYLQGAPPNTGRRRLLRDLLSLRAWPLEHRLLAVNLALGLALVLGLSIGSCAP